MQLKKLYFKDMSTGWCLQEADFSPFTLLVGASGVGKTRILNAIKTISELSSGKSFNGIEWKIVLYDEQYGEVIWKGKTEYTKNSFDSLQMPFRMGNNDEEFNFLYEEFLINNEVIFKREDENTVYKDIKTVKLQKTKSLFYLLQEEDIINIKKSTIVLPDSNIKLAVINSKFIENIDKFESFESLISEYNLSLSEQLFIIEKKYKNEFDKIKNLFLDIFPFVEDLQFKNPQVLQSASFNPAPEMQALSIKEIKNETWISSWDFSSGMKKTLALIAQLFLSPKGSILLIDEFENSFGVNCIESISKIVIHSAQDKQIILTSHHPYIINNIPSEHWKLVTRKNSNVSISSVKDKLSTRSKHDAFMQLINLDQYAEGIES